MYDIAQAIQEMVDEAVARAKPDLDDNVLTKKDAVKLLKKYANKGYLRKGEAAEYLGISPTTFWKWRKENEIKSYTIDDITVYKKSDLDAFMEKKAVKRKE